jgi:16S rRNA (adenine1518-N6/adenine1519-N6)-dimethyltransferase
VKSIGHRPRKRFGQHFLHDPSVISRIVAAIDPQSDQRLIEIGPGLGALSRPVLERVGRMEVVELDRDVIPRLEASCVGAGELVVHQADALRFDFAELAGDRALRVIGNLPYNISTPLLFHLLDARGAIEDMHFMLQKEVVDRMVAEPGSKTYGRLSVMLQAHCEMRHLFDVKPGAFKPPPRVMSAIVRLEPLATPAFPIPDPTRFAEVVLRAFGQRRKTLRNALKGLVDSTGFETADVDSSLRAETLPPSAFGRLAASVAPDPAVPSTDA